MTEIVGIGTEITECLRIARMIERHGDLFINRVFTSHEVNYCRARKQATQHFTARWAAKGAILKALGTEPSRGIRWRDIEIRTQGVSQPSVAVRGGVRDWVEQCGVARILVSMSYCRTHATAHAVVLGPASRAE